MIGIDICSVKRFERLSQNDAFLDKIFTTAEIEYCSRSKTNTQRFAVRFAAKEAFAKAVGRGFGKYVKPKEIEVCKNDFGQPMLKLLGTTKEFFENNFDKDIYISLSHEKNIAIAVVVLQ